MAVFKINGSQNKTKSGMWERDRWGGSEANGRGRKLRNVGKKNRFDYKYV